MKKYFFLLLFVVLLHGDLQANNRRILGIGPVLSWASSYLTIEAGSVTVQDSATWTYATAMGIFFDYMINPYISYRTEWFIYPAAINHNINESKKEFSAIELHAIGFSLLRHFNLRKINPWFGTGPYLQFSSIGDVDSYIIHLMLSLGFDYELYPDVFLCPEFKFGLGMKIIRSDKDSVVIDVPGASDFSTSGFVLFAKIGVAKAF